MRRDLLLVANPAARGGRTIHGVPAVVAELSSAGFAVRLLVAPSLREACDGAAQAAADGAIVASHGGDGLTGALAGPVADAGGVLAVLPAGRGNDFARALGVPRDPLAAARTLAAAVERRVDLGVHGDRTFLGVAGMGLDSVVGEIAERTRLVGGPFVYPAATLRALAGLRALRFRVEVDGAAHDLDALTVEVANSGRHGGGMLPAPEARLDDGLLDVVVFGPCSRRRFVRRLPMVFDGSHVGEADVTVLRGREVAVTCEDEPFSVWADGERLGVLPGTFGVRPGALRVLVPPATVGV